MSARYGGEISIYEKSAFRKTTRVPSFNEVQAFKRGEFGELKQEEVIQLLLNFTERLETLLSEEYR